MELGAEFEKAQAGFDLEILLEPFRRTLAKAEAWTPALLGMEDALEDVWKLLDAGNEDEEHEFRVPLDSPDGNLAMLLASGVFEALGGLVESGSWPHRVLHETLFLIGGRNQ
jgi:hypothetical protein